MEDVLLFLLLSLLQPLNDEVPGQTDDPVTLHHVVPRHYQVISVSQVPQFSREPAVSAVSRNDKKKNHRNYLSSREQQWTMCLTEMLSSLSSWISPSSLIQDEIRKASSFSMLAHSDILLSASFSPFVMKSTMRKPGVEAGRTKTPSSLIIMELESLSASSLNRLISTGQEEGRERLQI